MPPTKNKIGKRPEVPLTADKVTGRGLMSAGQRRRQRHRTPLRRRGERDKLDPGQSEDLG
ncbi:hypothetical protein Pflav_047200 [Phytohabitans flavus]|uniref:Uncharacterized protein n=1 Tax=Phytohabitans flavus TaxID=1076124 RepID=A0A6F8XWX2_9ACTN|nr:hypothetical protein Pflav_047200 [Phytohabitans flavus]